MTTENLKMKNKRDLSHIDTVTDLEEEIIRLRATVKLEQDALSQGLTQVPREAFRAGVGKILPFMLNAGIADKTFNIIRIAAPLLFSNPFRKKTAAAPISAAVDILKQVGVVTAIRGIKSFLWRRKKKQETVTPPFKETDTKTAGKQ